MEYTIEVVYRDNLNPPKSYSIGGSAHYSASQSAFMAFEEEKNIAIKTGNVKKMALCEVHYDENQNPKLKLVEELIY